MSVRAHSGWFRWVTLVLCGSGCQAVFGDFSIDRSAPATVLAAACPPNAYRCEGATLQVCADDRSGFVAIEACASADECDPTAGGCHECTPGEYACNENVLLRCVLFGGAPVWEVSSTCGTPELCSVAFDRRGGRCDPLTCEPGSVRCTDDRFEQCVPSGRRYELVELCSAPENCSASDDAEVRGCLPPDCDPDSEDCAPPECVNGSVRCQPGNLPAIQRCTAAGQYVVQEACAASALCSPELGACLPPACELGEKRCFGQKFQTCRGDRAWFQTTEECGPGETCDPTDGCVKGRCSEDSRRCNGRTLERCTEGAWEPQQICATTELCDAPNGVCNPPVCGADLPTRRCDPEDLRIVQQCNPDRKTWREIDFCDDGETCTPERDPAHPGVYCITP